jgi:DNA-binding CsgD family transcriptional regulator
MIASPVSARHLVGRSAERSFFEARLESARGGTGSTILVFGEPGTGKTRLVNAWLETAAKHEARTAYAGNQACVAAAFGTVTEAIRALVARDRRSLPSEPDARALLARFLDRLSPDEGLYQPWLKRRIFVVVQELLQRLCQREPAVLAIDDLHAADPESLELIQHLASHSPRARAIWIVTARPFEAQASPMHRDAIAALERGPSSYRVVLGPLSAAETRELIFAALPPHARLTHRTVEDICRRSEGNPLFVEDLVRDALYSRAGMDALPQSVEQSVRRRIDELPPGAAAVIEIAAAIPSSFGVEMLAGIAAIPVDDAARAVRGAHELNLLAESGEAGDLRFRHELIREAVGCRLMRAERCALHARIARWLESREPPPDAGVLAYHWFAAGDADRACEHALRSARGASGRYAFATARDHFESALASGRLSDETRADVLEELGCIHELLGSDRDAEIRFDAALPLHRAAGRTAPAARLSLRLANIAYRNVRFETACAYCHEALDVCAPGEPVWFTAHVLLGTFHAYNGDLAEAEQHLAAADTFGGVREPAYVVRYHAARAAVCGITGRSDDWHASARACVDAAERYGDPAITANCWINLAGFAGQHYAEFELAERGFARAVELCDAHALAYSAAYARIAAAGVERLRGDLPQAYALVRAACALGVDAPLVRIYAASIGIPTALDVNDHDLAGRLADDDLLSGAFESNHPVHFGPLAAAHVELLLARDQTEPARRLVQHALAKLDDASYNELALLTFARCGTRADVRRVLHLFDATTGQRTAISVIASTLAEAMLATLDGDEGGRRRHTYEAMRLAQRTRTPLLEAFAWELSGDPQRALAMYRTAGSLRDAGRLEKEQRRLPVRRTAVLTRREQEIASLVALGHSNRTIAEKLVLSERTVEHHVASALGKFSFRSRAELAAFIAATTRSSGA